MATITATVARAMAATYKPTTTITKAQSYVTSGSLSTTDVIILDNIKIPHGAIVTDVAVKASFVDGVFLFEVGTRGSNGVADLFGSKTFGASQTNTLTSLSTGIPATISVSDDAAERYQTLVARVDGNTTSGTGSLSLQFIVQYYCP